MLQPEGYLGYFHYAEKKGYSGVGIYSRTNRAIVGLGEPDSTPRDVIRGAFDGLTVVSLYLPSGSSGQDGRRQIPLLERSSPIWPNCGQGRESLCGDWNIAHRAADLKNWRANRKNSGFLPEERAWFTRIFDELGLVDVYRVLTQIRGVLTWWSNRGQAWTKNVGWRIDYQIATPASRHGADADIYKEERFSDHAPLTVDYDAS